MKSIIDGLIISLFILTNYTAVFLVIVFSPTSTFGKIMMCIFETILFAEAIKCLEELE